MGGASLHPCGGFSAIHLWFLSVKAQVPIMENFLIVVIQLLVTGGVVWLFLLPLKYMNQKTHEQFLEKEKRMTPEEKEVRGKRQAEYRTKQMEKERKQAESSLNSLSLVFMFIVAVVILAIIKWAFATLFG